MDERKILKQIAEKNGVSPEEVEEQIQKAIAAAMETSRKNNNEQAIKMWDIITNGTGKCSAAQLIRFLGQSIWRIDYMKR